MTTKLEDHFSAFEVRCLRDQWGDHTDPEKVLSLWAAAPSKEAFIKSLQDDADLKFGLACGVLSRMDFYFIREMIGDRQIKTTSDAGGVRVQHDGFSVLIPNGHGDGVSRVAVFGRDEPFNAEALHYFTHIEGPFDVCAYDCSENDIALHLDGAYNVYFGASFVVFVGGAA